MNCENCNNKTICKFTDDFNEASSMGDEIFQKFHAAPFSVSIKCQKHLCDVKPKDSSYSFKQQQQLRQQLQQPSICYQPR